MVSVFSSPLYFFQPPITDRSTHSDLCILSMITIILSFRLIDSIHYSNFSYKNILASISHVSVGSQKSI